MTLVRLVAASVATSLALMSSPTVVGAVPIYTTNFDLTEPVISEGGRWSNAASPSWSNVQTSGGLAFGTQTGLEVSPNFNDSTALLSGFSPNVTLTAVVHVSSNIADGQTHEVELLLRMAQTSSSTTRGYEMNFDTGGNAALVRWNGPLGDYTFISHGTGNPHTLQDGDVFTASVSGTGVFKAFVNGTLVLSATDSTFLTGQPGIGFFIRDSVTANAEFQSRYAFTSFTAVDDTPLAPVPEPAAIGLAGAILTLAGWYGARRMKRGHELGS